MSCMFVMNATVAPPAWLVAWVALAASAISLSISLATFLLTQRRPRVQLISPNRIRVNTAGDGTNGYIYLQPILINTGRSTRAEVVAPALVVTPPGGVSTTFEYTDKSKAVWDAQRREVHVEYVDDAAPIIVNPNTVKSEMLTFRAPAQFRVCPGWYTLVLTCKLTGTKRVLAETFQVIITEEHLRIWLESDGRRYVMLPVMKSGAVAGRAG